MIIKVNNKEMELSSQASLQQLAETLQMPDKGVAVNFTGKRPGSCDQSCLWWISLFVENNQSYIH